MLAAFRPVSLRRWQSSLQIIQAAPSTGRRNKCLSARRVATRAVFPDPPPPDDSKRHMSMVLNDERTLAWREYGDEHGFPVIFMHGNLNSRLFEPSWSASHADAVDAGAKVVAVDRPGYGGSSFHAHRSYKSWADDISQLAKHLDIPRFAVVGFSSGGPHALACATLLPEAVACCGLVSSDGPYKEIALGEEVRKVVYGTASISTENSMELCAKNEAQLRSAYMGMKREERRELALADLEEAIKQGLQGPAQDCLLETGDWGFEWREVEQPVLIWHGDEDASVPVAVARHYQQELTGRGRLAVSVLLGEGHNLIRRNWKAVLDAVVRTARDGCSDCC